MTLYQAQASTRAPQRGTQRLKASVPRPGFTLIELILVMTILTIAVSVTAPALANFFRGRSLDSEARRLLALTRQGQSRAVSEGVPVELWIDSQNGKYGLETEPSFEPQDDKAVELTLGSDIQLEAVDTGPDRSALNSGLGASRLTPGGSGLTLGNTVKSRHPDLPRIRFLPDGTIAETSPQKLCLTGRDGFSIWLIQSRNGLGYELSTSGNENTSATYRH